MNKENKTEILSENIIMSADDEGLHIESVEVEKIEVDKSVLAICDLCSEPVCAFGDLKKENLMSPEKMIVAVDKGLLPVEILRVFDTGFSAGFLAEQWKKLARSTETDWALCDGCVKEVESVLRR